MTRQEVEQSNQRELAGWAARIRQLKAEVAEFHDDSFEILEAEHRAYRQKLEQLCAASDERWEAIKHELDQVHQRLENAWKRVLAAIG